MADKQKSYYYKEIEAAFGRFKEVFSSMLPLAEGLNMPDVDVIKNIAHFEGFTWSKHPSVINLNLSEDELTDNQKEEIALSNKAEFDATIVGLNELCDLLDTTLRDSDIITSAIKNIVNIILDSMESNLIYDYNGELKGDYEAAPLILTAEELYWALSLLGQEKTRLVISEQAPNVFDSLYNAYQKGKESFTYAFSNLTSTPMKGLRPLLMSSINDTDSFLSFVEDQLMSDKRLLATIADEILGSGDSGFSMILNFLLFGESVGDLNLTEMLNSYENEVGKALTTAENIEGLSRIDKKQLQKATDSLPNQLPNILENQAEELNISSKTLNVMTTLIDKWLVIKIHEHIKDNIHETANITNHLIGEDGVEATEITLMRFFDGMLVFNGQKRIEFINKYVKNLSEFFSVIDKTIALYSFASLFYPSVPKLGRYSKDQVSPATRLMGGIQWKTDPKDEKEVIDMLITLNPAMINSLKPCKEETLSPARRMDYLVKLYCDKSDRYSWIKDFIEDYWPQVAREEFERKYKIKK
ncbi:hypothetical protein [Muribaculum intestinale]|uniref:hypothetical protein n=1 Tax=Muribaculum intestinale TaxID=1796646 RepID=UPI0025A96EA6|nr:hypothetical protein [Muribaculum intestinale]